MIGKVEWPRRCVVASSDGSYRGVCHGLHDGYAVIETGNGGVESVRIAGEGVIYGIKFTDRLPDFVFHP
jgi:hypothetical protein